MAISALRCCQGAHRGVQRWASLYEPTRTTSITALAANDLSGRRRADIQPTAVQPEVALRELGDAASTVTTAT